MNQVIIAKSVAPKGMPLSIISAPYQIGFCVDDKTTTDDIINKDAVIISKNDMYNDTKSIILPKNREVKYSLLPVEATTHLDYELSLVANTSIDIYLIDSFYVPNDYKYNIHVDVTDVEDNDKIDEYITSIFTQLNSIFSKLNSKHDEGHIDINEINFEDGKIHISLGVTVSPKLNIKLVGKNLVNVSESAPNFINVTNLYKSLIDEHIQQFGINHREYDNNFYEKLINDIEPFNQDLSYLFIIRFKNPRAASVTHDEDLYQNVYILATNRVSTPLKTIFGIS